MEWGPKNEMGADPIPFYRRGSAPLLIHSSWSNSIERGKYCNIL